MGVLVVGGSLGVDQAADGAFVGVEVVVAARAVVLSYMAHSSSIVQSRVEDPGLSWYPGQATLSSASRGTL